MLFLKLVAEILILWILYILYMGILVYRKGPLGGIFFYPKVVQDRVVTLGLITKEEIKKRRAFAYALLLAWMLIAPGVMILLINGVRGYFDLCWQFYVLFLGAEFYDWLFIDTIWVANSDWWLIPGTGDLDGTWHDVNVKKWKFLKLIPCSIPLAAIVGGLYFLIGKAIG